jgi:hypothetical protein
MSIMNGTVQRAPGRLSAHDEARLTKIAKTKITKRQVRGFLRGATPVAVRDRQRQQRGLPAWSPRVERDGHSVDIEAAPQ